MIGQCETCVFWFDNGDSNSNSNRRACLRHAPIAIEREVGAFPRTEPHWPQTWKVDGCGDHQLKKLIEKKLFYCAGDPIRCTDQCLGCSVVQNKA